MSAQILQVKFSVKNYYEMIKHGILLENPREEIIDGLLYRMPPSTPAHAAIHSKLGEIFYRRGDEKFLKTFVNFPITINEYNEPIPDYCFLKIDKNDFPQRHPMADEVNLILEISDATIDFDRNIKLPLYAAALIPEIWLINLIDEKIEVYSQTNGEVYNSRKNFQRGETVKSSVLPNLEIEVDRILG